ncbi:hypothetical protein D3C84_688740 [compost metagenome]
MDGVDRQHAASDAVIAEEQTLAVEQRVLTEPRHAPAVAAQAEIAVNEGITDFGITTM